MFKLIQGLLHPAVEGASARKGDSLVITDANDEIIFAGRAEVETVDLGDSKFSVRMEDESGTAHVLNEAVFFPTADNLFGSGMYPYQQLQSGSRPGDAYEGLNELGEPAIWYFGRAADGYLLQRSQG